MIWHVALALLSTNLYLQFPAVNCLTVGTCNLWNVMFNWKLRVEHIAEEIQSSDIDIVAFQEVRTPEATSSSQYLHSQLDNFRALLPEYKWIVFSPAGKSDKPKNAYWLGYEREGVGIVSRKQILSVKTLNLTQPHGMDKNPRTAIHAAIRVGPTAEDVVNIFVVHFSYSRDQQCRNAADIVKGISGDSLHNSIIIGDFNAYSNFPGPVDMFTRQRNTVCSSFVDLKHNLARGMFKDAWLAAGLEVLQGLTFSNMPSPGLQSRPDLILVPKKVTVENAETRGNGELYKEHFYHRIILHRARAVLAASWDSFGGQTGYSCLHDCGPHGSCRCGVCVNGGNQLTCTIPECKECNDTKFILFLIFAIPFVISLGTLIFSLVKMLVVSARFSHHDLFDILGYRCCLFNTKLFRISAVSRRYRTRLSKIFCICTLPPVVLLILTVVILLLMFLLFRFLFNDSINVIFSILPEELFPSDHLLVYAKLSI